MENSEGSVVFMKKPAKFNTYLDAMNEEAGRWSLCEVMKNWGINEQELNECAGFENFIRRLDEIPEQKTCVMKSIRNGAMYDVFQCTECGTEFVESKYETYVDYVYCPICGAKVVY